MSELKFGIIGCGRIAQRHAEHISRIGKLVAICDIDEHKARSLAEKYGAAWYTHHAEMLGQHIEMDTVSVCTPNGLHAAHSIDALRSGFHVLCEKPMAIKAADCVQMITAAEMAGKKLMMVMQNRFNPPVAAVKKILDEGRLGEIYSVQLNCFWNREDEYYINSWKGTRELDGGTLFTQFSHFIDLLYWMFGDVEKINGFTGNFHHQGVIEFEDTGALTLKFTSGALGTINYSVNSFEKNMEGSLTIFGEHGTVKIGGQYLNELEYQNIRDYEIKDLPAGNPPNQYGKYTGSMSNHDKVYQNLQAVLTEGAAIATTGLEGLKTVELIERIYAVAIEG
ncbi:Gfo/Idh/MocA family protein [Ferruginibacter sp. HRS2-29]|uniref:Gfo/Idh/MocA family protein n=1 Tax=Ferruginibacter sp. HRS2-29 TaxID=2487334 RepID=UPI0020CE30E2|nr:Gfo/Idh/MocA family oxidoreductase [Ferruginibacter sp. HRS2-29]MCP9751984.1 gfo/Idh/MocA family oxidoreductase [Ferruginibacter sp. HRS2-29]